MPHLQINSLLPIWRSGTRKFYLRVPDLQMSCSDLTTTRNEIKCWLLDLLRYQTWLNMTRKLPGTMMEGYQDRNPRKDRQGDMLYYSPAAWNTLRVTPIVRRLDSMSLSASSGINVMLTHSPMNGNAEMKPFWRETTVMLRVSHCGQGTPRF